jgi:hypothetical protein
MVESRIAATALRRRSSGTRSGYLRFTLSYRDVEELLVERGSTSLTKPSDVGC